MSEENKNAVRRLIEEVWNKRNPAVADELLTPDSRNIDPATPDLGVGPEAYRKLYNLYTTAFPDLRFTIDDLFATGDRAVVRWTTSGTHRGDLRGISPTRKQVSITGTTICRIVNGKIAEQWVVWDALGLYQQLGVIPETRSLGRVA
jgi:steroid delta-isomerase-like uncharacterized protein